MSDFFRTLDLQARNADFTGTITGNAGLDITAGTSSFHARPKVDGTNVALVTDIISPENEPYIQYVAIDNLGTQDDKFDLWVEGAKISDFGSGADANGRDWRIRYALDKKGYLMRFRNAAAASTWYYSQTTFPCQRKKVFYLKTNNDGGGSAILKFTTNTKLFVRVGPKPYRDFEFYPLVDGMKIDGILKTPEDPALDPDTNHYAKFLVFDIDVDLETGTNIEIAQRIIQFSIKGSTAIDWTDPDEPDQ